MKRGEAWDKESEFFAAVSLPVVHPRDQMWRRIALLLYTYYKIYYLRFYSRVIASWTSTTTDLIACGGTSGHVHETIDDLSKTSRNTHLSSVSRFWRNAQLVVLRATCEFEEVCCGVLWSLPVLKHSKKRRERKNKKSAHRESETT